MKKAGLVACLLTGTLTLAVKGRSVTNDDPWNNLRRITRQRCYTFVIYEGINFDAEIIDVADRSIKVRPCKEGQSRNPQGTIEEVYRYRILRVEDGPEDQDVVFTAASHWRDLTHLKPLWREAVRVVTKTGKTYQGKLIQISDSRITFRRWGRKLSFPKEEIKRVYYVRTRPITDDDEHALTESGFECPLIALVILPRIFPRISVLLYDTACPPPDLGPCTFTYAPIP